MVRAPQPHPSTSKCSITSWRSRFQTERLLNGSSSRSAFSRVPLRTLGTCVFCLLHVPPLFWSLFPYTTLFRSRAECTFVTYRGRKSSRLHRGHGSTTPQTSLDIRVVGKYWIHHGLSNGSSPAATPVHVKMQHNELEVSIPNRKTLERQLVAVCLL